MLPARIRFFWGGTLTKAKWTYDNHIRKSDEYNSSTKKFFSRRGWDKALNKGGAVGQAHKRIALLCFACL
jgi:hypothetical protein